MNINEFSRKVSVHLVSQGNNLQSINPNSIIQVINAIAFGHSNIKLVKVEAYSDRVLL